MPKDTTSAVPHVTHTHHTQPPIVPLKRNQVSPRQGSTPSQSLADPSITIESLGLPPMPQTQNEVRPCRGCVRSHGTIVANLVKAGQPFPAVPECTYDGDFDEDGESHVPPQVPHIGAPGCAIVQASDDHHELTGHPSSPHEDHATKQLRAAVAATKLSSPPAQVLSSSAGYSQTGIGSASHHSGRRSDSAGASVSPVSTFSNGMPGIEASPDLGHNAAPLFDAMPSGYSTDLPSPEILLHLVQSFFQCQIFANTLLHRSSFLSRLQLPPSHPQYPSNALLHAICADASLYGPSAAGINGSSGFGAMHAGLCMAKALEDASMGRRLMSRVSNFNVRLRTRHGHLADLPQTPAFKTLESQIASFRLSFPKKFRDPFARGVDPVLLMAHIMPLMATIILQEPHCSPSLDCVPAGKCLEAARLVLDSVYRLSSTSFDFSHLTNVFTFFWTVGSKVLMRRYVKALDAEEHADATLIRNEIEVFRLAMIRQRLPHSIRNARITLDLCEEVENRRLRNGHGTRLLGSGGMAGAVSGRSSQDDTEDVVAPHTELNFDALGFTSGPSMMSWSSTGPNDLFGGMNMGGVPSMDMLGQSPGLVFS
ncbi:hypothetical protein FRC07_007617 [Ceratobasidium sp. 392]|nr:hypothetical protein FRC07_007617 [Ceratobasidium sp. 392]